MTAPSGFALNAELNALYPAVSQLYASLTVVALFARLECSRSFHILGS